MKASSAGVAILCQGETIIPVRDDTHRIILECIKEYRFNNRI